MSTVSYPHIEILPDGVAIISGTRTKVVQVVLDRMAHHGDADEIHRQHPHLSLAQIHSALAYYYDHQAELDRDIEERWQRAERIQQEVGESPLRAKLRKHRSS